MTVGDVLDRCAERGVVLWVDGDTLQVRGPAGSVTPEIEQALRRHKAAILSRLQSPGEATPAAATLPATAPAAPPAATPAEATRPMSIGQQGLWFLHRLEAGTLPAYNIRKAVEIERPLDLPRWQAAFQIGRAHV